MQEVRGDYAPSFFLFVKPTTQNSSIQLGVFSAKMKGQLCYLTVIL